MKDEDFINYMNEKQLVSNITKKEITKLGVKEFIKKMCLINPQSYGNKIEYYLQYKLNGKKVKPNENRGDILVKNKYIEIKSSIITKTNNSLNLVQIRLFQNIDYYLFASFDVRDIKNFKEHYFLLSHDEMFKSLKFLNMNSAHGTKQANKNNKNIEYRVSIKMDKNDTYYKYFSKYEKSFSEIKSIFLQGIKYNV